MDIRLILLVEFACGLHSISHVESGVDEFTLPLFSRFHDVYTILSVEPRPPINCQGTLLNTMDKPTTTIGPTRSDQIVSFDFDSSRDLDGFG